MARQIILWLTICSLAVAGCVQVERGDRARDASPTGLGPQESFLEVDPQAFPPATDLPKPPIVRTSRQYTGVIRNKTRYEVSVVSPNSGAGLVIPPHGWIEFIIWSQREDVTVYRDGKPFYCLKLFASPSSSPFMCKKYDFLAEIIKDEPPPAQPAPKKKKKRVKKKSEC
jgi:hypothetical protein